MSDFGEKKISKPKNNNPISWGIAISRIFLIMKKATIFVTFIGIDKINLRVA
jgi:hypothetical protein